MFFWCLYPSANRACGVVLFKSQFYGMAPKSRDTNGVQENVRSFTFD